MRGQLEALSEQGAAMIAAAERMTPEFAVGALVHDRDGTFAVEHLDKLRADRFLVSTLPANFGGGGVLSAHDLLVAMSRIARTDPSTAIGVNMHFSVVHNIVRAWSIAVERWDERRAERLTATLQAIAEFDLVFAAAASEPPPQDLLRPATTATRAADGWIVSGRKAFATMSRHASMLNVAVTFVNGRGDARYGFASIPATSEGVVFEDDWDALGMRASASGSVTFKQVHVADGMLADTAPAGVWSAPLLDRYLLSGALHGSASLGIAEGAHAEIVTRLQSRPQALADAFVTTELAANVVDLTAMRATLGHAGRQIDRYLARYPMGDASLAAAQQVTSEVQAAKAFLNQASVRVVDRALALSGGAGYRAADPLAKAWRDVRAGAFMHPTGANRVAPLLAGAALGEAIA